MADGEAKSPADARTSVSSKIPPKGSSRAIQSPEARPAEPATRGQTGPVGFPPRGRRKRRTEKTSDLSPSRRTGGFIPNRNRWDRRQQADSAPLHAFARFAS